MIRVNLLSPEKKEIADAGADAFSFAEEKKEEKINPVAGIGAAVLTLGIIGFLYFNQANTLEQKKKDLNDKTAEKARLKYVEDTLRELEETKKDLNRKVRLIGELKGRQQTAVKMMDKVSNSLPEWVWLNDMKFSGNRLTLGGNAVDNNLISDFMNNLKATNNFINLIFPGSSRRKFRGQDIFSFSLTNSYVEKTAPKTSPTGKQADVTGQPKPDEEEVEGFVYKPAGRRDPFLNILGGGDEDRQRRIQGIAGLEIDQLELEGIIFRAGKYIALFKGPDGKPWDTQVGQNVYDGQITKISANSVTFKKIMPIVVGGKKETTVIKYLKPEEESER
jgi:Tfp pilus assembly protein PilN/Tfp pilus assembly protein PilP